jgi:hypothetical protein
MSGFANGGIIKHRGSELIVNTGDGCDYLIPKDSTLAATLLEGQPGWYVPAGQDICPRCGDQNFHETERICITCTPDHPDHDPEDPCYLAMIERKRKR